MKANCRFYKGIEYVVVSDLPSEQQLMLGQKNTIERIKILMDGKIISNCISYQAYTDWYHSEYKQKTVVAKQTQQDTSSTVRIVFNKA